MAQPSTKDILRQLINELPEEATIADVQYRLYMIESVTRGRSEIANGDAIPHAQVAGELRAKWARNRGQ